MSIKKEFSETVKAVKLVLGKRKYILISVFSGLIIFLLLYYLLVVKVADNSIQISVMMSGAEFITASILGILIMSLFSGILFSMLFFKFSLYNSVAGKGLFGFIGSGIGAFGVGCPTCGAFLFGLIGIPLALMYLPFRGLELQALSILTLTLSIYFTGKSINGACKIPTNDSS